MSLFRKDLLQEISALRQQVKDPNFRVPQIDNWFDSKQVKKIETLDFEVLNAINDLHRNGLDNPQLSFRIIELLRQVRSVVDGLKQDLPPDARSDYAKQVNALLDQLGLLLDRATNNLVSLKAGIKKSRYLDCAQSVLSYVRRLKDPSSGVGFIKVIIYDLLTKKCSGDECGKIMQKFIPKQIFAVDDKLGRLKKELEKDGFIVDGEGDWFNVSPKLTAPEGDRFGSVKVIFKITYKEYFSLITVSEEAQGIIKEVFYFLDALPSLAERFLELSRETGDFIQFKTLNHLSDMLWHQDSLVVHHRKKSNGKRIRELVDAVMRQRGVMIARKHRASSGFDFKIVHRYFSKMENKMAEFKKGKSHSDLVAEVVADYLVAYFNSVKNADLVSVEDLARRIESLVLEVSQWPFERFKAYFEIKEMPLENS